MSWPVGILPLPQHRTCLVPGQAAVIRPTSCPQRAVFQVGQMTVHGVRARTTGQGVGSARKKWKAGEGCRVGGALFGRKVNEGITEETHLWSLA